MSFLPTQLASLEGQTWPQLNLYLSDDGSTDGTLQYLEGYVGSWSKGRARLASGPQSGTPSENFRALILEAADDADYYAFSDQDDIWLPDKLSNAIEALAQIAPSRPALHCARTELVDERSHTIGVSTYFKRPPTFRNAIIQSLAGGNTMVMNRAALSLIRAGSARTAFVAHDWWTYMLIAGADGTIIYSDKPDTKYRQHDQNVTGSNLGWRARVSRLQKVWQGRFRDWNDRNIQALSSCEDLLSDSSRAVLADFRKAREGSLFQRLYYLWKSRVYRQTAAGQLLLYVACLFRRI